MKKIAATIAVLALAGGCLEDESRSNDAAATKKQEAAIELARVSDLENGSTIAAWCADCHGENGVSKTSHIPHLAGQRMAYVVNELKAYKDGLRDNAAMHTVVSSLTEDAMRNVAAYYSLRGTAGNGELAPTAKQHSVALEVTPSVAKWTYKCDRCHEGDGFADPGRFPILTGQRQEYLARTMHAYQNRFLRASSMMHAMTEQLTPQDIHDISAYYAYRPAQETVGLTVRQ